MGMTDPVADMLTRLRNAQQARKSVVEMPSSMMKVRIAEVLVEEGYVSHVETLEKENGTGRRLRIGLKYYNGQPVIEKIERSSKPGRRRYVSCKEIPVIFQGLGIAVLSTSRGVLSSRKAKEFGVGGELLCIVY